MNKLFVICLITVLLFSGCGNEPKSLPVPKVQPHKKANIKATANEKVIDIVPFEGIHDKQIQDLYSHLKPIFSRIEVKAVTGLPVAAWYAPRKRYKADTLLRYLASITPKGHVSMGVTNKDISTSNGNIPDWGIFGYGYMPGNACVVSTFRLHKNRISEELYKIAVHELGHTQGLDHCKDKTCLMHDAEGKNSMGSETDFCNDCKNKLMKKGWKLNPG
jgi:archaemetzincin